MDNLERNKNKHILELAGELLDDIELSRIPADALLLKCSRLARLTENEATQQWLKYEMSGYSSKDSLSIKYVSLTGRWVKKSENKARWQPLGQIESYIKVMELELGKTQLPSLSGDGIIGAARNIMIKASQLREEISAYNGVRSRVLSLLHDFVVQTYYERIFSGVAENIFEKGLR